MTSAATRCFLFAHPCRRDLLDISPLVQDAAAAIVDDSFLRCFQGQSSDPWNWNIYLFPLWAVGLAVRYVILFPLRCALNVLVTTGGGARCVTGRMSLHAHRQPSALASCIILFPLRCARPCQRRRGRMLLCHRAGEPRMSRHARQQPSALLGYTGDDFYLGCCRLILLLGGFLVFFIIFFTIEWIHKARRCAPKLGPPPRRMQPHPCMKQCWALEEVAALKGTCITT